MSKFKNKVLVIDAMRLTADPKFMALLEVGADERSVKVMRDSGTEEWLVNAIVMGEVRFTARENVGIVFEVRKNERKYDMGNIGDYIIHYDGKVMKFDGDVFTIMFSEIEEVIEDTAKMDDAKAKMKEAAETEKAKADEAAGTEMKKAAEAEKEKAAEAGKGKAAEAEKANVKTANISIGSNK